MSEVIEKNIYLDPKIKIIENKNLWFKTWQLICRDLGDENRNKKIFVIGSEPFQIDEKSVGIRLVSPAGVTAKVEKWGGWLWAHVGEPRMSLQDYLAPVIDRIDVYQPEKLYLALKKDFCVDANWKLSADAFSEAYHVGAVHPTLLEWQDPLLATTEALGQHAQFQIPVGIPSQKALNLERFDGLKKYAESCHIEFKEEYLLNPQAIRLLAQKNKRNSQEKVPYPYKNLSDNQLTDVVLFFIFPNIFMNFTAESLILYRFWPDMISNSKSHISVEIYSYQEARNNLLHNFEKDFFTAFEEDIEIVNRNQKAIQSRGIQNFVLSKQEQLISHRYEVWKSYVLQPIN